MLNVNQQRFVDSESNFILGLAPAGSGKTHSMISKIEKLAENRIHPRNILCITFTRAAGVNIRERAERVIGPEAKEMFANTFHAFAIKVISENARHISPVWEDYEIVNGRLDFTIYDQQDRSDIIRSIISNLGLKVSGIEVERYIYGELAEDFKDYKLIKMVANEYKQFCIENIALDLDDLINLATELLKKNVVRQSYNYEYVFVDEYQDTNDTQNALIKALNPKRLIVIGDDSQSIYAFNRAKIEYILNFENEWPDVEIITLEDNYRSTRQIVSAAKMIVDMNKQGRKKNIVAHKDGPDIKFFCGEVVDDEFSYIKHQIEQNGGRMNEHTVLCRTNAMAKSVAEYLRSKEIPVNLVSNVDDPFKNEDVRRIFKFIQFALNQQDTFAFQQCINFPVRRMTDFDVSKAIKQSQINETPITAQADPHFKYLVEKVSRSFDKTASETYQEALDVLGVVQEYAMKSLNWRIRNLNVVDEEIRTWQKKASEKSFKSFLRWLCIKDIQEKTLSKSDMVNVMTLHASKGLEWDHVYICGVTEGVFPNQKAGNDIEEERRLMHVGITRAKETVNITAANYYRTPFGQIFCSGPSEFYKLLNAD